MIYFKLIQTNSRVDITLRTYQETQCRAMAAVIKLIQIIISNFIWSLFNTQKRLRLLKIIINVSITIVNEVFFLFYIKPVLIHQKLFSTTILLGLYLLQLHNQLHEVASLWILYLNTKFLNSQLKSGIRLINICTDKNNVVIFLFEQII